MTYLGVCFLTSIHYEPIELLCKTTHGGSFADLAFVWVGSVKNTILPRIFGYFCCDGKSI